MPEGTTIPSSWLGSTTAIVGIAGSLLTIGLTYANHITKSSIDAAQQQLHERSQRLEEEIKKRSANVEESKERVERYKWVYSLVPELSDANPTKRGAALAMVRLALTRDEASALLDGLEQSPDEKVRQAAVQGRQVIVQIENTELRRLVEQMDASTSEVRRAATGRLQRDYADSAAAVRLVVDRLTTGNLAPSGLFNSLYYLSRTEGNAWTPENIKAVDMALPALRKAATGDQSKPELQRVEVLIAKYRK